MSSYFLHRAHVGNFREYVDDAIQFIHHTNAMREQEVLFILSISDYDVIVSMEHSFFSGFLIGLQRGCQIPNWPFHGRDNCFSSGPRDAGLGNIFLNRKVLSEANILLVFSMIDRRQWTGVVFSGPAIIPDPKLSTPFLRMLARYVTGMMVSHSLFSGCVPVFVHENGDTPFYPLKRWQRIFAKMSLCVVHSLGRA